MHCNVAVNETHRLILIDNIIVDLKERPMGNMECDKVKSYFNSLKNVGLLQELKTHFFYDVKKYNYSIVVMKHKPQGEIFKFKLVMPHHIAGLIYQYRIIEYLTLEYESEWI